jgi:ABC-type branched-subunit amino acid transport system ATPase component
MRNKLLLEIIKLKAGYGELEVLKSVDLELGKGQIVAVIGPNGAGKSTVIKSVFNIADVRGGGIKLNGKDIRGLKTHELIGRGVSYVPQGRVIFGNLTVRENLEVGFLGSDLEERIKEIYSRFPVLKERKDAEANGLSGGERQMLALGRSLMLKPKVLMLDEPSLGLSPRLQKELFDVLEGLKKDGIGILIVEQNAKKAIEIADKTYLLEDGKVALSGGREILKKKAIKQVYLGGRY